MKSQGQVVEIAQEPAPNRVYGGDWVAGWVGRTHFKGKKTSFISNPRGSTQPNSPLSTGLFMGTQQYPQPRSSLWPLPSAPRRVSLFLFAGLPEAFQQKGIHKK